MKDRQLNYNMRSHFMTREDPVGSKPFDSIEWLFETHLRETDTGEYNFAVLYGPNENAPIRIELWRDEPNFDQLADKIWYHDVKIDED